LRIVERDSGDVVELQRRAAAETSAIRRDRYRAVLLAIEGKEAVEIAHGLGRSRRSVQDWAYAYRDGGTEAIQPKRRTGRTPRLPPERQADLKARLDAGPIESDGVCTLRGKDIVRILEQEFGVKYTLGGVYELLERLNYSCLVPRPRHEKGDAAEQDRFRGEAPFLSRP
jgi:transposase